MVNDRDKYKPFFDSELGWIPVIAGGEGNGDGTGEGEGGEGEGTVSKEEFDKVVEANEKLSKDLDDMRLEVLSPSYMEFLDNKDKGKGKEDGDKGKKKEEGTPDVFEKMSKKEIYERAKQDAEASFTSRLERDRKETTRVEIKRFAATHDDYETYRPIMYGMSLDPKYKDASLETLYSAAKAHIGKIHGKATKEEKLKQSKIAGEKPGGSSESYDKLRKMSAEEATKSAVDEVVENLGPIPSA